MLLDQNALPLFRNPGACGRNQHLTWTTCISPSRPPHGLRPGMAHYIPKWRATSVSLVTLRCEVRHHVWVMRAGCSALRGSLRKRVWVPRYAGHLQATDQDLLESTDRNTPTCPRNRPGHVGAVPYVDR